MSSPARRFLTELVLLQWSCNCLPNPFPVSCSKELQQVVDPHRAFTVRKVCKNACSSNFVDHVGPIVDEQLYPQLRDNGRLPLGSNRSFCDPEPAEWDAMD